MADKPAMSSDSKNAIAWASPDHRPASCIDNAHPDRLAQALSQKSLGFSFSGGGFLLPYYMGNIRALTSLGLIKPGVTHVGGSSAGSLAAAVVACGLSVDVVMASVRVMIADCREKGVFRRLGACLRAQLEGLLPADAHVRCSGTAHIGITKVKLYGGMHSKRASHFETREELIEALLASCHLPLMSTGSLTTRYRGRTVMDGGFTDLFPVPSQPHHVVKITCLPLRSIERMPMRNKGVAQRHISLSPCRFREWPYSAEETMKYAISPGPDEFIDFLLQAGHEDVMSWAKFANIEMPSIPRSIKDDSGDMLTPTSLLQAGEDTLTNGVQAERVAS